MEFPGFVKNQERAMQMLGGGQVLFRELSSESPKLKVCFRPGDPLCHPIESERVENPCVVIRVRVVKRYCFRNGKKVVVGVDYFPQLVCKTSKSNCFRQASDFQFLPAIDSPLNTPTVVSDSVVQQSFMYFPPPVFMHSYKYDAKYIQKRIFASQGAENTKLWKGSAEWIVNQNDLIALERGPRPPERANDVTDEMLSIFVEMFERRPIWTSLAIYDHLVSVSEKRANVLDVGEASPTIFHALACVAYHIKTGPYKMCWVKYGINPLLNENYKMYQIIVVSLRDWSYAEEVVKRAARTTSKYRSKKIGSTPVGISTVQALPDRLYFGIQLIDIVQNPLIEEVLGESNSEYSFSTGWFSQDQISAVRDFIVLKYTRMMTMEGGEQIGDIIMANVTSVSEVRKELSSKRSAKKSTNQEHFDFEFVNEAQGIIGVYDSNGNETVAELLDVVSQKTCCFVIDRMLSY